MRRFVPGIVLAAFVLAVSARADDTPPNTKLDPKVRDVLAASAAFYAAKKSVEADIASSTKISTNGMKQQMDAAFHLALARPNSLALTLQTGMMGGSIICDGKTCVTFVPIMSKYTTTDAPEDWNELLSPMTLIMAGGTPLPLGLMVLRQDPVADAQEGLSSSRDFGIEKINGVAAHHVKVVNPPFALDFWIADGPQPVLLQTRSSMDFSDASKQMSADQKKKLSAAGMTMDRTSTFTNWKFDQPVAADTFVFHPPAGAESVTDFIPQPPHPLLGKPAPDFTLTDLDGKSVSLASLRGKIVVLDFWATWCGPCVAALPSVVKAASAFKGQGVVFYTVNLKEKPADIRKFQSGKNLAFPVLLDADGTVADLYQADAIPQTMVIDQDGKVAAVHVGYKVGIKQLLTRQLTDLLTGKPLAP